MYQCKENGKTYNIEELKTASKPLMDYLKKNYHPHVTAIVTNNSVEIVEGLLNYIDKEGT
jgi:ABC-type phosphate/phosphonate transport system substrate-binding protein